MKKSFRKKIKSIDSSLTKYITLWKGFTGEIKKASVGAERLSDQVSFNDKWN